MKKITIVMFLFLFISGCAHYGITEYRSGIFDAVQTDGNLLQNRGGNGMVWFEIVKFKTGKDIFYGAEIVYKNGWTNAQFRRIDGVMLTLNDEQSFYLAYKKKPEHIVSVHTSGGGGTWMSTGMGMGGGMMYMPGAPAITTVNTTDRALVFLTKPQLAAVLKADTIVVSLISDREINGSPMKQVAAFGEENLAIIKRFYAEYISALAGAAK